MTVLYVGTKKNVYLAAGVVVTIFIAGLLTGHFGIKSSGDVDVETVREEVERWQMRNEEVEQKLQMWMGRAWSLKQVIIEQQNLVRALQ